MCEYTRQKGFDLKQPSLENASVVTWARNKACTKIRPDADFVLMCDDDMLPEPDHLVRLMNHDMPAVSALTTSRGSFPPTISHKIYNKEKDAFYLVEDFKENTVLVGPLGLGTGFLLLKREVIEKVREYWLSAQDWVDDNAASFKRMKVARPRIEIERKRMAALRAKIDPPQLFELSRLPETQGVLGEDIGFSRRLIMLGYDTAVDTTVQVGHIGDFAYGPWLLNTKSDRDVRFE